ncbi:MAG TPA: HEAT repeat domain-containing protein [Pyrinomonadaceae bacterium]|jgi:cyclophilin family peptidyl-prolyl cis-trans isomerase/HEAT repeat protein|nr:HEAT repeat domain-containing protein [Pyrinomonadaceae bacterium]
MKNISFRRVTPVLTAFILLFPIPAWAQKNKPAVSSGLTTAVQVQILKAEDERRWDKTLETLLHSPSAAVRKRAALAAGRIGDDAAVPALAALLEKDADADVRAMAAFALGETESEKAADAILKALLNIQENVQVRARAIEAAGKIAPNIAAANKPVAEKLGAAILHVLDAEWQNPMPSSELVSLGLTAALRVRPEKADLTIAKFLKDADPRVRADAANTLARLRAKNANDALHTLLADNDPVVRANAARALGAAEDKTAYSLLLGAVADGDLRVRVSAIRALGSLKDAGAAKDLLERGSRLLDDYKRAELVAPSEKNELLEIAGVLGRLLPNSNHEGAVKFLKDFDKASGQMSPEVKIALAQVSPRGFYETLDEYKKSTGNFPPDWHMMSSMAQALGELAKLEPAGANKDLRDRAMGELSIWLAAYYNMNSISAKGAPAPFLKNVDKSILNPDGSVTRNVYMPDGDILSAYAAFKTDALDGILQNHLKLDDLFIRAAAAGLLAEQPASKENVEALKTAFTKALLADKQYNDAQLAIMDALFKLDKKESVGSLLVALSAPDYLVRKKAFELLRTPGLEKDFPGLPTSLENAVAKKKDQVLPYSPVFGTKLGQVLNTTVDYTRAAARKNGRVKAVLTTGKGSFTIDLLPEDAPLTVDNFIKLARANYFNGVSVHRVAPNFVMQDGDPRGDGNGGPGWSIRCEVNMVSYQRGAVGMALSGKDTGGSQWFVTHSPQPHLDGGYTVFGTVNETDMKVVDRVTRGDKIINIKIIERK